MEDCLTIQDFLKDIGNPSWTLDLGSDEFYDVWESYVDGAKRN